MTVPCDLSSQSKRFLLLGTFSSLLLLFGTMAFFLFRQSSPFIQLVVPPQTILLEDKQGRFLSEGNGQQTEQLGFWNLSDELPKPLVASVIGIEDQRFFQHRGVDFKALMRATLHNLLGKPREGASTIAMQVARLQNKRSRTYWNKALEMVIALRLVHHFGHQKVLHHYLQILPQGNRIHGAAYAARRYFKKPLNDLNWAENAILAALPKSPNRMNPYSATGFAHAKRRAILVLEKMLDQGHMDQETFDANLRFLHGMAKPTREIRPSHSYHAILRMQEMQNALPPSQIPEGPIRSYLDLDIQEKLQYIAIEAMDSFREDGAGNIAIVVASKDSGKVLGYLGSENYFDQNFSGSINFANRRRSTGSTLKPFIFALGLESKKYSPASMLTDEPREFRHKHGNFTIENYDGRFLGKLLYRKALANSRNLPAIEVLEEVGIESFYHLLETLKMVDGKKGPEHYGVGMAIGGIYSTLERMIEGYGTLANGGKDFKLRWLEGQSRAREIQHLSENTARQISLFLSDPLARLPSFSRKGELEYPFPVAVKTGTSQGFRDAWALAYSSKYVVAVWVGRADNQSMKHVNGSVSARVLQKVMYFLHPNEKRGQESVPFPPPKGFHAAKICASDGTLATPQCHEEIIEYFQEDQIEKFQETISLAENGPGKPFPQASVSIVFPLDGSQYRITPETPRSRQTLKLQAKVNPPVYQILWKVDGKPHQLSPNPYSTRWALTPGVHTFQAVFPNAQVFSEVITIKVNE